MKKRSSISIKTKITTVIVLIPMISLIVVGIVALYQNRKVLVNQAEFTVKKMVLEKTSKYDMIFQRIQEEVDATSKLAGVFFSQPTPKISIERRMLFPWTGKGYGNEEVKKRFRDEILKLQRIGLTLHAVVNNNPYLTLGYLGTKDGLTVFDNEKVVSVIEKLKAFDVRERPWYVQAKIEKKLIWTNLYVDANTKKLVVTCAAPVYDNKSKFIGVVGFDVLLETLQNEIKNLDIGYKNSAFMINKMGFLVVKPGMGQKGGVWHREYRTDNLLETKNPKFNEIVGRMVAGKSGVERYVSLDGEAEYLGYAPIKSIGYSIGVIVPQTEITRPVEEAGKILIVILAIVIIISLGVGLILSNQITRPIEELTVFVDRVSKGLTEVEEIPIKRSDEIGVLASSFNRLMRSLSTLLEEQEERNKE